MFINRVGARLLSAPEMAEALHEYHEGHDLTLAVAQSARPLVLAALWAEHPRPCLLVVAGEEAADRTARTLAAWLGMPSVSRYPARKDYPWSDAGYDDAILKSVSESQAAHPEMTVHLIRPKSQAEALALMNDFTTNGTAEKALILCGPQFESLAQELHPGAGRILLIDSQEEMPNGLSTLQLKRYGGAWLAGALSKRH